MGYHLNPNLLSWEKKKKMFNPSLSYLWFMSVEINNQHGHWFVSHLAFPASHKQGIYGEYVALILCGYVICIYLSKQSEIYN